MVPQEKSFLLRYCNMAPRGAGEKALVLLEQHVLLRMERSLVKLQDDELRSPGLSRPIQ